MESKELYYIDKLLPLLPTHKAFIVSQNILDNFLDEERTEADNLTTEITEIMIEDLHYAFDYFNDNSRLYLKLTGKGRKAQRLGGHFKYIEEKERKDRLQESQIQSVIYTNESVRLTNESVKSINRFQMRILILTSIISAITCVTTLYSAYNDKPVSAISGAKIITKEQNHKDTSIKQKALKVLPSHSTNDSLSKK